MRYLSILARYGGEMGHRFDLGFVPKSTIVRPHNQYNQMKCLYCRGKRDYCVLLVCFSFCFFFHFFSLFPLTFFSVIVFFFGFYAQKHFLPARFFVCTFLSFCFRLGFLVKVYPFLCAACQRRQVRTKQVISSLLYMFV